MAERLLLVESDSTLCGQLTRFLTTLGYQIDAADSVGAALAAIAAAPPALTLLDAQLDEDPATIAFATRQCDACLIIMGRPEVADALVIDIGVEVSPDHVLHKPFSAQDLSDIVRSALKVRGDKAEAERLRAKASSELDAQLGALQAALSELTGMQDSSPPERSAVPEPNAAPEPSPDEAPVADSIHDLLAADPLSLPPLLRREPRSRGAAAHPGGSEQPSAPARGLQPSAFGAIGPLLDASAMPDAPLESMELIEQFALRPMTAESPLDPRGIYGRVTMSELLYFCFRDLFSGWLLLRRGAVTKTVLLRSGRPVFAQSNIKAETLGTMLVSAGSLTPEDSERSLRYADALGIRQGEAVVRLGMLSEEGLRNGLRAQLTARLTSCFSWREADYGLTYDPDAKEGADAAEVNPLVIIFEGVRTRYPLAPLMAHYDQLIRQAPRTTSRLADYATMLRQFREELVVAESCDGTRSLGEVLAISPVGLISTLRVLRALESMNCLTYGSLAARPSTNAPSRPITRTSGESRLIHASTAEPARGSLRPDEARATGGYRTVRTEDRTSSAHRSLRPTGAHVSGIRKATRRPGGGSATTGPVSRGPTPFASGAARSGARETRPDEASDESPSVVLDRIEAAAHSYAKLGVATTANRASISKAAASLLRVLTQLTVSGEPDIENRAKLAFVAVKQAGEALTNPQRRRAYDALNLPILPASGTDLVAAESDFKLGRICMASDAMDRARSYFERAASQDPHQAIYQVYLAWATFSLATDKDRRVRAQAVELAREALKSDSSRDDGHVLLGRMYQTMNSHDQAVRAFSKALEINSGNTEARAGLRQLEADQGDAKKDTGLFGNLFNRR